MKSIKKMTDDVIDLALEGMYSEIEEWDEEDGHHVQVTLSPKPELYEELNQYFTKRMPLRALLVYVKQVIDVLKGYFNQQKPKASGR